MAEWSKALLLLAVSHQTEKQFLRLSLAMAQTVVQLVALKIVLDAD